MRLSLIMPFTLAHPAIVLPFVKASKKYFSFTSIVIGSVTPDFEYFIRMKVFSRYSHTLSGILYFDIPVGILLFLTFQKIVRSPLINNLPTLLRERFIIYAKPADGMQLHRRWHVIILSLLIGIASHLVWDSFTHRDGFFVERLSRLNKSLIWNDAQIPIYKVAQHSSTAVGLLLMALVILSMKKYPAGNGKWSQSYWSIACLTALAVLVARLVINPSVINVGIVVVTSITGFLIGILASSSISRNAFNNSHTTFDSE
jgi:hypothetical protein